MKLRDKIIKLDAIADLVKTSLASIGGTSTVTVHLKVKSSEFKKEVDSITDVIQGYIVNDIREDFDGTKSLYMLTGHIAIFIEEER